MKAWKFCILLFVISFYEVSCWKKFWRGRIFDGGEQYELGAAEDLWFEQYLDHFDPTNTNTWKQVNLYSFKKRMYAIFLYSIISYEKNLSEILCSRRVS